MSFRKGWETPAESDKGQGRPYNVWYEDNALIDIHYNN